MERWEQIEGLFQEALQRDPAERDAYLREACRGDSGLQREVASLLANHHEATDFEPWAAAAAAQLIGGPALLQAGQRLGPYEILAPIGKGGMGKVYKARDTRLKRDVAIKICAAQFSERFEHEARAIAALNHPNICQIYDVGPNFLVMEFVDGPTLADRIELGPFQIEVALAVARQLAEALEAAHEKGIVHRDLKPANVKVTPTGVVKVLDFGLAKAAEEPSTASDPTDSPTLTMSPTRAGMILGTAAYMSPEQARGTAVDKRADIWAFGCVLYEILTGKQAFHGETTSDILASVLKEEPGWTRIPAKAQLLLHRCLVKDPKHRLRDIGDAMPLLEAAPVLAPRQRPWFWLVVAATALAFCIAAVGWWRAARPPTPALRPLVQLSASLPFGAAISVNGNQLALSPDASRIAISMRDATGSYRLATRLLDQAQFVPLPGTEGASMPFFSPDGQWIGFFADGKLKKIGVQGTASMTLCDVPPGSWGASWGEDDNIVAALNRGPAGLSRLHSGGGEPTQVTALSKERGETTHAWPQVLPGSQAVMFTVRTGGSWNDANIDIVLLKTGERKTVLRGGYFGRYIATSKGGGRILFIRGSTLFAAPFDLGRLATTGASQPLLEDVTLSAGLAGSSNFDFSQAPYGSGTFVYFSGTSEPPQSIFWLDSAGKLQPLYPAPGSYSTPRFSPDGKRLAFRILEGGGEGDIWVQDLDRGVASRLTHSGTSTGATWTPNGAGIVFETLLGKAPSLYWIRADGSGGPQQLTKDGIRRIPYSLSPDGKRLAYAQQSSGRSHIWTVPIEGDSDDLRLGKAEPFLQTPFSEVSPAFSPDGRWLAYTSNESGTFDVYVRPFPGPGAERRISTGGGAQPVWSRSGRELFFIGSDRRIIVASYTANGDTFVPGKPRVWSEKRLLGLPYRTLDLAPDGKRFAVILYADGSAETQPQLTVLLNFSDELKRRWPAGEK